MTAATESSQEQLNADSYLERNWVGAYDPHLPLEAGEALLLLRHHEQLSGSVLELGTGTGRITRHLLALTPNLLGIDISPEMVEACRKAMPAGRYEVGDLRDLDTIAAEPVDAIVAGFNVIDVLDHEGRMRLLRAMHDAVVPGGLVILSSHNLGAAAGLRSPWQVFSRRPKRFAANVVRLPRRARNHRRLASLEIDGDGWAVRNDEAHDYSLLHYYVSAREQARQFEQAGLRPLECLTRDGRSVGPGDEVPESDWLHYAAARPAA